jgi:hypothetical protein
MRGSGYVNTLAQNISATASFLKNQKRLHSKPKTCWKCQKDKSVKDGYLQIAPGLFKFICKDCMDAKNTESK